MLRSCTRVGSARCVQIIACIRTRYAPYLPLTARYASRSATGPHTRGCAVLSRPTALPHAVRPPHRRSLEPRRPGGPARPDLGDHDPPRASSAPLPRAPGCWHGEAGEAGALRPVERRAGSAPASHAPLHCAACAAGSVLRGSTCGHRVVTVWLVVACGADRWLNTPRVEIVCRDCDERRRAAALVTWTWTDTDTDLGLAFPPPL